MLPEEVGFETRLFPCSSFQTEHLLFKRSECNFCARKVRCARNGLSLRFNDLAPIFGAEHCESWCGKNSA